MAAAIEFYFDFSSPYGYLASQRIDEVAEAYGREVAWKPFCSAPCSRRPGRGRCSTSP